MNQNVYLVSVADEGKRLDQFLKERTGLTRSEVQKWIKAGNVSSVSYTHLRAHETKAI